MRPRDCASPSLIFSWLHHDDWASNVQQLGPLYPIICVMATLSLHLSWLAAVNTAIASGNLVTVSSVPVSSVVSSAFKLSSSIFALFILQFYAEPSLMPSWFNKPTANPSTFWPIVPLFLIFNFKLLAISFPLSILDSRLSSTAPPPGDSSCRPLFSLFSC